MLFRGKGPAAMNDPVTPRRDPARRWGKWATFAALTALAALMYASIIFKTVRFGF
jgi:hypothetical protein